MTSADDTAVIGFMSEIRQALKDILRRLDEGQEKFDRHEDMIQQQAIMCRGCQRDIASEHDRLLTLESRFRSLETDANQGKADIERARGGVRALAWAVGLGVPVFTALIGVVAKWL